MKKVNKNKSSQSLIIFFYSIIFDVRLTFDRQNWFNFVTVSQTNQIFVSKVNLTTKENFQNTLNQKTLFAKQTKIEKGTKGAIKLCF